MIGLCPRCGSVLSAVTFTCVRGYHCREGGFVGKIQERLSIIERMLPGAKLTERRKLQRERSDLEDKLRRVQA